MKLQDLGEFGFIERVRPICEIRAEGVVQGIGDDCAVLETPGPDYLLVTTDMLVERVHFLLEWTSAQALGFKALAVNLSDIAACGGVPREAFVSLGVPRRIEVSWLDELYRGMTELAAEHGVNLLGGDTTGSPQDLIINIAVTGTVPRREALFRGSARSGDALLVTGPIGRSAAGFALLSESADLLPELAEPLIQAHLRPVPHVRHGRFLAVSGACTAAIDISDGLTSDLAHICRASRLGAILDEEAIGEDTPLMRAARAMGRDPLPWALHGGEDYVLLAAVRPEAAAGLVRAATARGWEFRVVGRMTDDPGMVLRTRDGGRETLATAGWDHFRG